MSYLADIHTIGGDGGSKFNFNGIDSGSTLTKLWVWAGGWQIKAIKVWLSNGQNKQFGNPDGKFHEFTFEYGEHFTSLSLWGNGAGSRLGGIKFKTNRPQEFSAYMTEWGLKDEYPIDVGSGICMGVTGRSGSDIDCLAFMFINTIKSTVLTDVNYTTLHDVIPKVAVQELESKTYTNNTSLVQVSTIETSTTVTKKSSWSQTNKFQFNYHCEVKAGIPKVAEVSGGYSFTLGLESTYSLDNTVEKMEKFSFPVSVAPGKTVTATITIGRVTVDLPYKGTVQITCFNDSVLKFPVSGTYKGVTYTAGKAEYTETSEA
ncbi:aerolysin-like protein [Brachyhypopomus gauderio]|uniref:aerolysin-like protein n=1 Tax=Brachyhypopomus gauderio TaxID=698409 RepID=UPI0040414E10